MLENPWFHNPSNQNKVFVFADIPHLIKLLRNHFLDTGFKWDNSFITPKTIEDVLKHTEKNDLSIIPQVNVEHLTVKGHGIS